MIDGTMGGLLLIHGNPGRESVWDDIRRALPPARTVAAGTLPGFDGAGRSAPNCSLSALAESAIGWASDSASFGRLVVVGHSHGGAVALEIARRWPDRVRALVLVASIGARPHLSYRLLRAPFAGLILSGLRAVMERRALGALCRMLLRSMARSAFFPAPVPSSWLEAEIVNGWQRGLPFRAMLRAVRDDPCDQVRRMTSSIRAPVLVIHGDQDQLVPHGLGVELASLLPQARFVMVPGAGHMLPLTHHAALVDQILTWERSGFGI